MTTDQIIQLVIKLADTYPNARFSEGAAEAWEPFFEDLPPEQVAFLYPRAISGFPEFAPSPMALRMALIRCAAQLPTPAEAWEIVQREMRDKWVHQSPEFGNELVAKCVRIMGWRSMRESEKPAVERKHFLDMYTELEAGEIARISASPGEAAAVLGHGAEALGMGFGKGAIGSGR